MTAKEKSVFFGPDGILEEAKNLHLWALSWPVKEEKMLEIILGFFETLVVLF